MIGDDVEVDIEPALKLGMAAFHVRAPGDWPVSAQPLYLIAPSIMPLMMYRWAKR